MLISFSVANFRSIKEKQTIDMTVASKYHTSLYKKEESSKKSLANSFFESGNKTAPELLKSAVIYGANASGKSNIIKAAFAFNYVVFCFDKKDKKRFRGDLITPYDPFILDEKTHKKPTEFEIDFITDDTRYVYSFSYDRKRISYEKLEIYKGSKKDIVYEIKLNDKNQFEGNFANFIGNKDRAWEILKNTENNLFLPLNINEDGNKFLNPVYDWIGERLFADSERDRFFDTARWIEESSKNKNNTLEILKKFDLGISDLEVSVEEQKLPKTIVEDDNIPNEVKEGWKKQLIVKFKTINGYSFNKSQISLGTRSIFGLASLIFPILEKGGVLFYDELGQTLHPDVLVHLVKMFHNPKINKGNGQIIFTTHNDILLEKDLLGKNLGILRRDQIWFVSKPTKSQATELYSLVEFPVKQRDSIVAKYRNYDFGARPALKEFRW
jgi:hypothetical protein